MKYLILSKSNKISPIVDSLVSEGNSTLIDAKDILAAKNILKKSLNKTNINQQFEIINLTTSEKKYYFTQKKK